MPKEPRPEPSHKRPRGVLVEAENGPAIEYDETGIVLHLSDRVVKDLARRLPLVDERGLFAQSDPAAGARLGADPHAVSRGDAAADVGSNSSSQVGQGTEPADHTADAAWREALDPAVLGDVDAWDLRQEGGFYAFQARLPGAISEPRRYRRRLEGGAFLAETSGPLRAILALGGGRFCTTWSGAPDFPQHVVGVTLPDPGETAQLATTLRNISGESLLADAILHPRYLARQALPMLPLVQVLAAPGYDPRHSVAALLAAFDRVRALGGALGRASRVLALRLDLGFDQAPRSSKAFYGLAMSLVDQIASGLAERDAGSYPILLCPDAGPWWHTAGADSRAVFEALHQLVLRPGGHKLILPAPGYAFEQDDLGQPTQAAMTRRAELEAMALAAHQSGDEWICPLLCLAERSGQVIRASFRAGAALVLDTADPFAAGAAAGFALRGTAARIASVRLAEDDPQAVLLTCKGALELDGSGDPLTLDLGFGDAAGQSATDRRDASSGALPAASTSLRDTWSQTSRTGAALHRWALPASVRVN